MRKLTFTALSILILASLVLAGCATTPATPETIIETVVVEVEGETVVETVVVEVEGETVVETVEVEVPVFGTDLPRNQTLFFNGFQWSAVVGWNPYSSNNNNALVVDQNAHAITTMFESPYMYNPLDGQQYPLLADGPYTWNDDQTELTFKLKPAAMWSDGTPVTADDVAYTWASNVKYETTAGVGNRDFIDTIEAVDPQTVLVKATLNDQRRPGSRAQYP